MEAATAMPSMREASAPWSARALRAGLRAYERASLPTRVAVAQIGVVGGLLGVAVLPILPIALVVIPTTEGVGPPS